MSTSPAHRTAGDRSVPDVTVPAPPQRRRGRIKGLDGPRGLACIAILMVHSAGHYSPETTIAGKLGLLGQALIFFFGLSGFLLFLPFVRSIFSDATKQPDVRQFFIHRILRIFPVYILIFLIANYGLQAAYLANAERSLVTGTQAGTGVITDPLTLISNLFLVQTYVPKLIQTGINPSWSLSLEYAFYVALPISGAAMFFLRRRFRWSPLTVALVPPIVFIVIGIVGKIVANALASQQGITDLAEQNFGPNWSAVILRSFFGGSDAFAFGMIAAVLFVVVEVGPEGSRLGRRLRVGAAIGVVFAGAVTLALLVMGSNFQVTSTGLAAGLIIMVIVLPLAEGRRSRLAEVLDWKPFEYLGKISLGIYLWHFPLLLALGRWGALGGDTWTGVLVNWLILGSLSIICASITYRFVEEPSINLARKFKLR